MNVLIYSTPTCGYCHMAKQFLTRYGVPFTDLDVSQNVQAAEEMVYKSGQTGTPVIDIDDRIIVGFDQNAIVETLKHYGDVVR